MLRETLSPAHRGRSISFWSVAFLDLGRVKGRNKETNHECGRKGHKKRSYFKPLKKKITNIWVSFFFKKKPQTDRKSFVRVLFIYELIYYLFIVMMEAPIQGGAGP